MAAFFTSILAFVIFTLSSPTAADAEKVKVVTTTADLRNLVEIVGGAQVEVIHLASPLQDAEVYEPRPQDLQKLRGADMVVKIGLDYDLWIDKLLKNIANPNV